MWKVATELIEFGLLLLDGAAETGPLGEFVLGTDGGQLELGLAKVLPVLDVLGVGSTAKELLQQPVDLGGSAY